MASNPSLAVLGLALCAACRGGATGPEPAGDAARGFALLAERGCTGCHASDAIASEPAPRLERVGARLFPEAIEAALGGGARMPDCLGPLRSRERPRAALELTHFLAARGGPLAQAPLHADAATLERGRQLYHAVGCVACHAPFEEAATLARPLWDFPESFEPSPAEPAPPAGPRDPLELRGIAARTTLDALAAYLADPLAVHPAGRMPSLALDGAEAKDVAAYLLYEDELARGGAHLAHGPGLQLEVFEDSFSEETVDFDALTPVRLETATSFFEGIAHRDDDFAFRFRGFFEASQSGEHRFATTSDDGSVLCIDGRRVVDNDGLHSMSEQSGSVHLERGRHAFEVTFFEHGGDAGLEVSWCGPGGSLAPLSFERLSHLVLALPPRPAPAFAPDPRLAERGRARYAELGCAACHEGGPARAAPLAELDPRDGCLAREPGGDAPRYRLAPEERADLAAALRAERPPPRTVEQCLQAELARFSCGACHARGPLTGPDDARRAYFQVASGLDLGDQGRFPPGLERAGAKLKPAWLQAVLAEGGRARPYMKTRMPQFGAANVAGLPELFAAADAPLRDEREPAFSPEAVEAGKQLAGTKGLGCIQCHELAGHPSIGIPAVDLAKVHGRVYPGWFRELLRDPAAIGMNTRMPAMWVEGRSPVPHVLGGDPALQIDALWSYLSLGSSMPLPEGLVPLEGEYEVEVTDTPVCVGVFMAGVSPRTLAVGLPERVHYAFDVQNSRLARAWRGRFLDARGTWYARAGQLEEPAGEDVLEFPGGCAVMMLDKPDDPWPGEIGRAAGYRVRGRRFDEARRPVFEYTVCGVEVEESVVPVLRAGGGALLRRFRARQDVPELFVRLAVGASVAEEGDLWRIGALRVRAPRGAFVFHGAGGDELRVPMGSGLEVEYAW